MKYFTFEEFERSDTAYRHAIDNRLPDGLRGNVQALVDNVLDPLREEWGKPIRVTSGYRCEELNRKVGGAKTSHHCRGMAADITVGDKFANRRLFELIMRMPIPFTQLIDEKDFSWVHISYDPDNLKQQVLKL